MVHVVPTKRKGKVGGEERTHIYLSLHHSFHDERTGKKYSKYIKYLGKKEEWPKEKLQNEIDKYNKIYKKS